MNEFWFYFQLGLQHVLDLDGYDHILFLLALTVPYTFKDWKRILWLVTVFTLGHTLSLVLSAFGVVRINPAYVEFLIPITILVTAVYHIFTAGKGPKKENMGLGFFVTLFFGIIHGLGFSNYFNMMMEGRKDIILPLVEFALGVEVAQVIIVLLVMVLGFICKSLFRFNKRDWVMVACSVAVGLVIPMLRETWPG